MMGQNTFQRSGLTVNHGVYYIDTTVSERTQKKADAKSINVFTAGDKYDVFFLYAKKSTSQIYQLFVGTGIPNNENGQDFGQTNVKFGYVNITTNRYTFKLATPPGKTHAGDLPVGWSSPYDEKKGILTVTTNMSSLADDFDFTKSNLGAQRCQPATMCTWSTAADQCQCNLSSPYFNLCSQQNPAGQTICSWSTKDIDCPAKGCPAFQITFPSKTYFEAMDQNARPMPSDFNFSPLPFNWNIGFNIDDSTPGGPQCTYSNKLTCSQ
jgi:hypothetical protein